MEPVIEALAPAVSDDVGERDWERESDSVDDGVIVGVAVDDPVPVAV